MTPTSGGHTAAVAYASTDVFYLSQAYWGGRAGSTGEYQ